MFSSSSPDVSLFGDMLNKFAEGGPGKFVKNLKQAVYLGQETPESAVSTLRNYASVRGWDPKSVEKKAGKLQRIQPGSISSERYQPFSATVETSYRDLLGRAPTAQEIQQRLTQAGAQRINPNDPGAFSAFLGDVLASTPEGQAKIKTEDDLRFEAMFGPMGRTSEGYLKRGVVKFRPEVVGTAVNTMFNKSYPGLYDKMLGTYGSGTGSNLSSSVGLT
jgi:hypothetical protein